MRNPALKPLDACDQDLPSGMGSRLREALVRRPGDMLAGALAAACTGMILFNALWLQEGRHPAPLFGGGAAAGATTDVAPAPQPRRFELVARIQEALAERGFYEGPADGVMGARTATAIAAFQKAARLGPNPELSERLLATILTAPVAKAEPAQPVPQAPSGPPAPAPRAGASAPATLTTGSTAPASAKLMSVQRALAKLGYGPVTIDGKMGAETRSAIQGFERDRKMTVTGEPSPQVLRALHAMTGAPLE